MLILKKCMVIKLFIFIIYNSINSFSQYILHSVNKKRVKLYSHLSSQLFIEIIMDISSLYILLIRLYYVKGTPN